MSLLQRRPSMLITALIISHEQNVEVEKEALGFKNAKKLSKNQSIGS